MKQLKPCEVHINQDFFQQKLKERQEKEASPASTPSSKESGSKHPESASK